MEFVSIDGGRDGYSPYQCGNTMTVGQLIDFLREFDDEMPIYINNDDGYTYGRITYSSIKEESIEE